MKLVRGAEKTPQVFKKKNLNSVSMFFLYLFNLIGEKKLTRASSGALIWRERGNRRMSFSGPDNSWLHGGLNILPRSSMTSSRRDCNFSRWKIHHIQPVIDHAIWYINLAHADALGDNQSMCNYAGFLHSAGAIFSMLIHFVCYTGWEMTPVNGGFNITEP